MAAPTFADYLKTLDESVDEPSARNAFAEFTKRTNSTGPATERAAGALRQRLSEISGNPGQLMEHYGRDGLTVKPKASPSPGAGDAPRGEVSVPSVASKDSSTPILEPLEPVSAPGGTKLLVPKVEAAEMKAALAAWNAMADAITDPTRDLVTIQGQPYRRVTFWRKARKAYGIAMIVRSQGSDSEKMTASAEIEFTAPNGDKATGYGFASKAEEKLAKSSLHEIISRAYSRAFVRGLRDLIGFGEPSAEEAE